MEKDLNKAIDRCYEICDYMEKNGVVKKELQTSLRELLRREFLDFVIYLGRGIYQQNLWFPFK